MKKLSLLTLALFVGSAVAGLNNNQKVYFSQAKKFADLYKASGKTDALANLNKAVAEAVAKLSPEDQAEAKALLGKEASSFIPQSISNFASRIFSRKPQADKDTVKPAAEVVVLSVDEAGTPDVVEVAVEVAVDAVKAEDKKEEVKASNWPLSRVAKYSVALAAVAYVGKVAYQTK